MQNIKCITKVNASQIALLSPSITMDKDTRELQYMSDRKRIQAFFQANTYSFSNLQSLTSENTLQKPIAGSCGSFTEKYWPPKLLQFLDKLLEGNRDVR